MKRLVALVVLGLVVRVARAQGVIAEDSPSQAMAATVIKMWPTGAVLTTVHPGVWGYEEGVLLDGMAAEWHSTADGADAQRVLRDGEDLAQDRLLQVEKCSASCGAYRAATGSAPGKALTFDGGSRPGPAWMRRASARGCSCSLPGRIARI